MADRAEGIEAIAISFAMAGLALGVILAAAALLARRWPEARLLHAPLHLLILAGQLLDGATTWVGVENPFDLDLPPFREEVFLSGLVLETLGGFAYFVVKGLLGIAAVAGLSAARQGATRVQERAVVTLLALALAVIGFIPVVHNVVNFVAIS